MKKPKKYEQVTLYLPPAVYREYAKEAKRRMIPLVCLIREKLGIGGI